MVLITGATSGIGYAFAKRLAKEGKNLILVATKEEKLNQVKSEIEQEYGVQVHVFVQDLSKQGAAEKLYQTLVAHEKTDISILVNNAGVGSIGRTETIDIETDEAMCMVNMVNLVSLTKLVLKDMYLTGKGHILNVASTGAFQPGPYTATYFASKSFVLSYSRAIREEAKERGVVVSTLCPGTTRTNFFERGGKKTPKNAMSPEKVADMAYCGLMKNRAVIVPGVGNQLLRLLPVYWRMIGIGIIKKNYCKS